MQNNEFCSLNLLFSDVPVAVAVVVILIERLSLTFTANGKRQNGKLLPSVFSSLYSRIKIFVFAVNSKRHFSIFVGFIQGYHEKNRKTEVILQSLSLTFTADGKR